MIDQAARVAEAIDIPLIVDADEAGDSVASVARSIRQYGLAGVAGVHIEDETTPKHAPWDGPLLSITDMQARIEAAVNARTSDDFVIIARSNEFMVADFYKDRIDLAFHVWSHKTQSVSDIPNLEARHRVTLHPAV